VTPQPGYLNEYIGSVSRVEYYLFTAILVEINQYNMPSTSDLADPKEYQKIFHWAETQKDATIPSFATRRNDPYKVCLSQSELSSSNC